VYNTHRLRLKPLADHFGQGKIANIQKWDRVVLRNNVWCIKKPTKNGRPLVINPKTKNKS
jgi:hypothetical protein